MADKPVRFSTSDLSNYEKYNPEEREKDGTYPHNYRIEYSETRLSKLIDDRGIKVYWEHGYLCTCRNPMTQAPDPDCPYCHGRGVAYLKPEETKMAIQSQERNMENEFYGVYDMGTAIATTYPNTFIAVRDRITVPQVTIENSMIFDVTSKRIDKGIWLPYDVKEVTLAVTEGNEKLREGIDFSIDYEKNTFHPTDEIMGKVVSLNLKTMLRYIVIDIAKEVRYQTTNMNKINTTFDELPRKLVLQRESAWTNHMPFSQIEDKTKDHNTNGQEDLVDTEGKLRKGGFFGGVDNIG